MKKMKNFLRINVISLISIVFIVIVSCEQQEDAVVPSACFNVSKSEVKVDETIVFDNCSMDAKSYSWDFGDGKLSSGVEPTHSYSEAGEYIVTLRAMNREEYDEDTKIIYVSNASVPVEACFLLSSASVNVGQAVSFTNCSTGADSYSWSFGDGSSSTSENPNHVYNTAGNYIVVLTASNDDYTDTYQKQVTVINVSNPEACFTYSPSSIEAGQTVSFNNCSSNADTYYWDFGDGTNSTAVSPSHVYNEAGSYNVTLTATGGGNSDSETKQLTVNSTGGTTVRIDFSVEMSIEYIWGRFDFDIDFVDIAGSFNDWGDGTQYKLTYTGTEGKWYVGIDGFEVGQNVEFKFRINGDWSTSEFPGGGPNRIYTVQEGANVVEVWYNDVNQVTIDPEDYYGVPVNSFSDYFMADFESDSHGFHLGSAEDYYAEVTNGHYVCEFTTPEYIKWLSTSYEGPDENSNYQIEYYMKITEYSETNGSGVIWGMNDDWDNYHCRISPFGGLKMGYIYSGGWESWTDWISGGNESPAYNKITIRKLADMYYVYRNEEFIYEHAVAAFFGNRFGVAVNGTQKVEFDYIYIENINLNFGKTPGPPGIKYESGTKTIKANFDND